MKSHLRYAAGAAVFVLAFELNAPRADAQTCVSPPPNMISWWPGEGNTTDIISGNNGTWIGNPAFGSGEVGSAFSFDGASYVSMGNPASLNLTGAAVTIDGWINPAVTNNDVVYFGKTAYGENDYALIFQFNELTGMIKTTSAGEVIIGSTFVPPLGQWTHLALTYDGTTMKLYVNGVVISSLGTTGNLVADSPEFSIGGRTFDCCGRHFFFTGEIDEVEVFDRALTDAEIAEIFNAGSAGKCKPAVGTPGYWMNHPQAWCTQTINIGCVTYTKAQAIAIMQRSTSKDLTYAMASQWIAAELNVNCSGTDSSCVASSIANASSWLCQHRVGSNVKASSSAWKQITPDYNTLVNYNEGNLCAPARQ